MKISKSVDRKSFAIKFVVEDEGRSVGRAYLYILRNDLHDAPFGFLEDVYVDEICRGQGIGKSLVQAVVAEAVSQKCYKLICTSRYSSSVHSFYEKLGFRDHGKEFRIDIN